MPQHARNTVSNEQEEIQEEIKEDHREEERGEYQEPLVSRKVKHETKISTHTEKTPKPANDAAARACRGLDREMREDQETAFEIAVRDPWERATLNDLLTAARKRVGDAAAELIRSLLALIKILAGRTVLALTRGAYRRAGKSHKRRSRMEKAQVAPVKEGLVCIHSILSGWIWRRILGQRVALSLLGGISRGQESGQETERALPISSNTVNDTSDTRKTVSLKVGERAYLLGEGQLEGISYALALDGALVKAVIGVSLRPGQKPVYRVRRFIQKEPGSYAEVCGYHSEDPEEAYREFASNPGEEQLQGEVKRVQDMLPGRLYGKDRPSACKLVL